MTAIKIGERYRITRAEVRHFGRVGVVVDTATTYDWELRGDDGYPLFADSSWLELVTPPTPSFSNGDVVKLTSPDGQVTVRGPVRDDVWIGPLSGGQFSVTARTATGWSLEVVEHAPKPLPTMDGMYVAAGLSANPNAKVLRLESGMWFCEGVGDWTTEEARSMAEEWAADGGLSRLIEEPTS